MTVFVLALVFLLPFPAHAEQATPADMTAEDRIELTRIEDYLNALATMKAGFTQIGASGTASTGMFFLSRPGKLRFDYSEPQKDVIIADGKLIWYYDAKMKEANHAPISRTFADFLLRPRIELSGGDVTVTDYREDKDSVTLTLTQTGDPGAGSLTLTLATHPLQIRQWRVLDAQGRQTEVTLDHAQFGVPLDRKLFVWREPDER